MVFLLWKGRRPKLTQGQLEGYHKIYVPAVAKNVVEYQLYNEVT